MVEKSAVLQSPRAWLGIQLIAVIALWGVAGLWTPEMCPDTASYVGTSAMPFRKALVSTRTLGYPLLLRWPRPLRDARGPTNGAARPDRSPAPGLRRSVPALDAWTRQIGKSQLVKHYWAVPWLHFALLAATVYFMDLGARRFGPRRGRRSLLARVSCTRPFNRRGRLRP